MAEQNIPMECKGFGLLATIPVNGTYILGIYKGGLSEYDILIKYRQSENGNGVDHEHQSIFTGL